ncbi:hypothetical protein LLH03_17905 [bacterium]|nr:hypothetical protein [bacterium]
MTDALAGRTREAIAAAQVVVQEVCGSCGNSCCHQGTMMGTHDLRRLVKGMVIEPGREATLREGLQERARELRADLATLQTIARLMEASPSSTPEGRRQLAVIMADWEEFCELIEGPWQPTTETLQRMLRFAGIRALALRALAGTPGGHAALSTLAKPGSSFKFRGRRLAPPRCLFHDLSRGCLAGRWKPGKCANFFCAGDPNVLRELRKTLSFDDFVLSSADVVTSEQAVRTVQIELELGLEFVEPKVFIGLGDAERETILASLRASYPDLEVIVQPEQRYMQSSMELEVRLRGLGSDGALLLQYAGIDGAALYELAIALDRHRGAGEAIAFVLSVEDFVAPSALPHPLWADEEMSQPLGSIDIYVVEP